MRSSRRNDRSGAESRRYDQFVHHHVTAAAGGAGADAKAIDLHGKMRHPEAGLDLDPSGHEQPRERRAEFAARGELVVGPAAEGFLGLVAAHEPEHLRARRFSLRCTRSISVPMAEWPLPSTATVLPA